MDDDDFSDAFPTTGDPELDNDLYTGALAADPSVSDAQFNFLTNAVGNADSGTDGTVDTFSMDDSGSGDAGDTGNPGLNVNASALTSLANSASQIFGNLVGGQTDTVYDPYGNEVADTNGFSDQISNLASTLTSALTSFLPLILIGFVLYLVFGIFKKHTR